MLHCKSIGSELLYLDFSMKDSLSSYIFNFFVRHFFLVKSGKVSVSVVP